MWSIFLYSIDLASLRIFLSWAVNDTAMRETFDTSLRKTSHKAMKEISCVGGVAVKRSRIAFVVWLTPPCRSGHIP